jgi:hypothetical protein
MFCKYRDIAINIIALICLTASCFAQSDPYVRDTRPVRGIMPYSDQISSPIDSIDPVSGKVGLSVPLGSLPAGRDGFGFDVELTYMTSFLHRR